MKTLDSNYKSQLENSAMKERLLKKENIYVLEDILHRDSHKLKKLQRLEKNSKLKFGNEVSGEELKELFPKICSEVNSILNVQDIEMPKFGYYNLFSQGLTKNPPLFFYLLAGIGIEEYASSLFSGDPSHFYLGLGAFSYLIAKHLHSKFKNPNYSPYTNSITLKKKEQRTKLIPIVAHEYTHHIQKEKGLSAIFSKKNSVFSEGHARGIQRQISENYAQKEDNEAFLYESLDYDFGEFKSAYLWICKKLKFPSKENLLKTETSRDDTEDTIRSIFGEPTSHALGNTLFSIYETNHGKEIYKNIIHGDFKL